ncbi:MAG: DNA repair protein RecN [Verrucomicrobiota bacterium]|nr:DNA repair protein RecN [Limisphaera sp.]MDW8382979.1 DNA repair protein RecN [Verrucomicrobiota bacterium]
MLLSLRIKNLALVEDLTWELGPGYHAITGETGAGKSILIGALELVLGERADRTRLRSGADSATVEAIFDVRNLAEKLDPWLGENGLEPCEEGRLILKRTVTAAGTNRQFVNGSPTTVAVLKQLGDRLVDIHGPHEHQSLLQPSRQLELLDAFGGLQELRAAFARACTECTRIEQARTALVLDEAAYARQLDLLRHQVREIQDAQLQPEEEETLGALHQRLSHAARLLQLSRAALDLLSESEESILSQAGVVGRALQEMERLDPAAAEFRKLHLQAMELCLTLARQLSQYADRLELDPSRLQEVEQRLDLLHSLKRKYGRTISDVLAFGEQAARQLAALEKRETELARLQAELTAIEARLRELGAQLSTARRKTIPELERAVRKHLKDLGFAQSHFEIQTESALDKWTGGAPPSLSGFDRIEFLFAPNPGEPPRPLRAIASSGELARVMLALKTVLAAQDEIPVLVFDEVDANVGGETAHAVGAKMREIAAHRQVLCVTHLAAVAAPAAQHWLVRKVVRQGRTVSEILALQDSERVEELARMLGGRSEEALRHAQILLERAQSGHTRAAPRSVR